MQLKEIFRHGDGMLALGAKLHRAYRPLKERFSAFEACLRRELREGFPRGSFSFLDDLTGSEQGAFGVRFCGKEVIFCFDVNTAVRGVVTCISRPAHGQFQPVEIGSFSFNEQGYTDDPDGRGPLKMDDRDVAAGILVAFLLAAFEVEGRSLVSSVRA